MLFNILFFIFVIIVGSAAYAGFSAAPWLPTRKRELNNLIDNLDVEANKTIYDLGCGTGSLIFPLAENFKDAKIFGFEISILPFFIAFFKQKFGGEKYKNVKIEYKNLFKQNLTSADIIFVFLLESCYPKLMQKFKTELKPDCLIIIEAWPLKNITPYKTIKTEKALTLYIYQGKQFQNLV